jgi:2-methylisocitrate lyase-like PEP mutase family enzyme
MGETERMDLLSLHTPGEPLLLPNAWDAGSARLVESLGARALATTSSGFAATLGLPDGQVTRYDVLTHCANLVGAVGIPVSADLENGYATSLEEVATTYRMAADAGLAGASIEDWSGSALYPVAEAADRVAAARSGAPDLVLTGRAEGYLRGEPDLGATIARLQAYAEAGADVLYAPGMTDLSEIRTLVAEVPRPVNVLLLGDLTIPALADARVARISVGGQLAWAAWHGAAAAARDFLGGGVQWRSAAAAGRADATPVIG